MSRVTPVIEATATTDEKEALPAIHAAWDSVLQLARVIARSTPLTRAMLAFDAALTHGRFSGAFAEPIAVAVASDNRCPYCLAAHTAAGRAFGLDEQTLSDVRAGTAADPKIAAALSFAQSVVRERGHVSDAQLDAVRAAGWTDGDIVELVGHAIATTLTNYLHHLSDVPVDFLLVGCADSTPTQEAA